MALATHRNFGRAAKACFVSQPTLSTQIRKLEEELGADLFDRTYQPIRPTEIGQEVIKQARLVLAERDRIPAIISDATDELTGELRLAIIPTLAPYLMPIVAGPFAERYPNVDLTVEEMTTEPLVEAVAENRVDAGLIATAEEHRGLISMRLFDEPFVAYVAPRDPLAARETVTTEDLLGADLWLLDEGHCLRDQVLALCERGSARLPMRFRSGNLETLRNLIDRIGGVTLLPYLATVYLKDAARLRVFSDGAPFRTIRAIHRRATLKQGAIDAFVRIALAAVEPELQETPLSRAV